MQYKFLHNGNLIRRAFEARYVLSWEAFQRENRTFLDRCAQNGWPYGRAEYDGALLWDKMALHDTQISFAQGLERLRQHKRTVIFMGERFGPARAEANALAGRIEEEWYGNYRLWEQGMYSTEYFLPEDLYVFDETLSWFQVFTHETTDWESELADSRKAAQSRVCFASRKSQ